MLRAGSVLGWTPGDVRLLLFSLFHASGILGPADSAIHTTFSSTHVCLTSYVLRRFGRSCLRDALSVGCGWMRSTDGMGHWERPVIAETNMSARMDTRRRENIKELKCWFWQYTFSSAHLLFLCRASLVGRGLDIFIFPFVSFCDRLFSADAALQRSDRHKLRVTIHLAWRRSPCVFLWRKMEQRFMAVGRRCAYIATT